MPANRTDCPHDAMIAEMRETQQELLRLLRGEGPTDPGVVGRILTLEAQLTRFNDTISFIRNTILGAVILGFLSTIGGLLLSHFDTGAK